MRAVLLACLLAGSTPAQDAERGSFPGRVGSEVRSGFGILAVDNALLWSSPFRSPRKALKTVLPLAAATAVAFSFDHRISSRLPDSADQIRYSKAVSRAGAYYSLGAATGTFLALGAAAGNSRAVETGLLAANALAQTECIAQMLKFAAGRERPDYGDATTGRFWRGQQSFPSGHAMGTWAMATVISKQYRHNKFIKYGIYALPILVSASRIGARRHFLSDIVVGGAIGHLMGGWIYNRHHTPPGGWTSPSHRK